MLVDLNSDITSGMPGANIEEASGLEDISLAQLDTAYGTIGTNELR